MPSYMCKEQKTPTIRTHGNFLCYLGVYICTSESGALLIVLVYCDLEHMHIICRYHYYLTASYVQWAHCLFPTIPIFTSAKAFQTQESKLPFLRYRNRHVMQTVPLHPLRIFKHWMQAMYSRAKRGVDAAAQFRASVSTQGLTLGW